MYVVCDNQRRRQEPLDLPIKAAVLYSFGREMSCRESRGLGTTLCPWCGYQVRVAVVQVAMLPRKVKKGEESWTFRKQKKGGVVATLFSFQLLHVLFLVEALYATPLFPRSATPKGAVHAANHTTPFQ